MFLYKLMARSTYTDFQLKHSHRHPIFFSNVKLYQSCTKAVPNKTRIINLFTLYAFGVILLNVELAVAHVKA